MRLGENSDCYTIIIGKFCTLGIPESALSVFKRMEVQVDTERISWLSSQTALGLYAGVLSALFRERNIFSTGMVVDGR